MTCNGENNLTGVFYRMNFENEDAVIAYFDKMSHRMRILIQRLFLMAFTGSIIPYLW